MRCIWKNGPSSCASPSHCMPSMMTSTASCGERSVSVSSMRRMKVPPCERANAHGYSAERMLPRWMKPVGDGANRVRTFTVRISKQVEAARQVGLHVVEVLQADGHAHQALGDARGLALGFGEAAMRSA